MPLSRANSAQRDAEVGGAAGVVGILVVAALHLEHVGERALEDGVRGGVAARCAVRLSGMTAGWLAAEVAGQRRPRSRERAKDCTETVSA